MDTKGHQKMPKWHRPTIRSLVRLAEQTNPTSISASSPGQHLPSITELSNMLKENPRTISDDKGSQ